ncbi:hypothetical protein HII31_10399, partial [Pseudocercospora fuligena]
HPFDIAADSPPEEKPYGAVVAAGSSGIDLSWMRQTQFQADWTTYPYDVDKPNHPDERLRIPLNKGHEAMPYLSWLIDNYDDLPWMTVFVHGHFISWHQSDTITNLIRTLNRTALAQVGYVPLRCDWYPSCSKEIRPQHHDAVYWGPGVKRKETEFAIAGNWRQLFPGEKLPETISSVCCAQFAVTRAAIRRRPRDDYIRMREWLIHTLLEDEVSGRVLEKLWAYIFTGEPVHCPPPQQCACQYFGKCDKQEWAQPPEESEMRIPGWP